MSYLMEYGNAFTLAISLMFLLIFAVSEEDSFLRKVAVLVWLMSGVVFINYLNVNGIFSTLTLAAVVVLVLGLIISLWGIIAVSGFCVDSAKEAYLLLKAQNYGQVLLQLSYIVLLEGPVVFFLIKGEFAVVNLVVISWGFLVLFAIAFYELKNRIDERFQEAEQKDQAEAAATAKVAEKEAELLAAVKNFDKRKKEIAAKIEHLLHLFKLQDMEVLFSYDPSADQPIFTKLSLVEIAADIRAEMEVLDLQGWGEYKRRWMFDSFSRSIQVYNCSEYEQLNPGKGLPQNPEEAGVSCLGYLELDGTFVYEGAPSDSSSAEDIKMKWQLATSLSDEEQERIKLIWRLATSA